MELYVIVLRCVFNKMVILISRSQKLSAQKSFADEWIKRTEAGMELNSEKMLNPKTELKHRTLAGFIK